jgi:hypothetical protein
MWCALASVITTTPVWPERAMAADMASPATLRP